MSEKIGCSSEKLKRPPASAHNNACVMMDAEICFSCSSFIVLRSTLWAVSQVQMAQGEVKLCISSIWQSSKDEIIRRTCYGSEHPSSGRNPMSLARKVLSPAQGK
jgi:hypothetical protein